MQILFLEVSKSPDKQRKYWKDQSLNAHFHFYLGLLEQQLLLALLLDSGLIVT